MRPGFKATAVGTLFAAASMYGCGTIVEGVESPEVVRLAGQEVADADRDARLGRSGLDGYMEAIETALGEDPLTAAFSDPYFTSPSSRWVESNIDDLDEHAIPLGEALKVGDGLTGPFGVSTGSASDGVSVTPYEAHSGSYVAYTRRSGNMNYDSETTALLVNDDEGIFGEDGLASSAEMVAFYEDPDTKLMAATYHNVDAINGSEHYELRRDGDTLVASLEKKDASGDKIELVTDTTDGQSAVHDAFWFTLGFK